MRCDVQNNARNRVKGGKHEVPFKIGTPLAGLILALSCFWVNLDILIYEWY